MNFTVTETALIALQILLIPFAKYVLSQHRKEIVNDLLNVLNEHYLSLENLIDRNKENIDKLSAKITHRSEIVKLKNKILTARLVDLENYLSKNNDFQVKCNFQIEEDDKDNSGIY